MEEVIPDLCLIDLMLPDETGNEITRKLRNHSDTRNVPVIMVTAKTSELDLVKGMEDGADDYIKKSFSVMELIARVKALLRRTKAEEVKEIKLDELVINKEKHEVSVQGKTIELTYKEYELLSYFIVNKGIVLSRASIMDHVWGIDYAGESRTIDMHVKTLRKKLGDYGTRIKTIRNVGYVIE
jgi:two-component system alkaline phosphatase synthesis response regulator PhoP